MAEMTGAPTTAAEQENHYGDPDVRERVAERCLDLVDLYRAFPDDYDCALPEGGGWIIVKRLPHTSIPNPPLYSIWWARPIYMARKFVRVSVGGRKRTINWPMLQGRIATEHGDLDLYPVHEFVTTTIEKWLDFIGHGVTPHFVGEAPGELDARLFYIRSRGIPASDALLMCLPGLTEDGSFVYFTLDVF